MPKTSSWQAIPADVLQRVFELQREGLANCGAASSCVAWRNVAKSSRVNHLHLHAENDRQEQMWPQLLAARRRVDVLKLDRTADRPIKSHKDYAAFRSDVVAEATIRSIPTACRSLCLSEFAAYGLEQYIGKSPEVQQLSVQWNGVKGGRKSFNLLPSFTALRQLTELTIHMRNDFDGDSFPTLVQGCPNSVESLLLEGFGLDVEEEQPPRCAVRSLTLLEDHLPALTRLELAGSVVLIPGEDITCLSKLRSLSLCRSEVYVDGQLEVTVLTKLTCLDLTETTCYWGDAWVDALDMFTAWPALAVLKALNCNLFDTHTVMDVSHVREVHMGHFEVYVEPGPDQQGHVHISGGHASRYDSMRAASIVDLTVDISGDVQPIDPFLTYVAANFHLQSFSLQANDRAVFNANSFTGGSFSNLTHLAIIEAHPLTHTLHLQTLTCLTSLVLQNLDCLWEVKWIELPISLEAFTFVGVCLFVSGIRHNLHELPLLTNIVFEIYEGFWEDAVAWYSGPGPSVPHLPSNLCHLVLAGSAWCRSDCDWSGLQACLHLQHLTLAAGQQVSGPLRQWVRSALCLYVLDHVERTGPDRTNYCRWPQLDDVPGWHSASTSEGLVHAS